MFDVSLVEILVLVIVTLLVIKPEKIPGLIKPIAKQIKKLKSSMSSIKADVSHEIKNLADELEGNTQSKKSQDDEQEKS